ncbi:transketolase family protein [Modestobacter lacusdianchii]
MRVARPTGDRLAPIEPPGGQELPSWDIGVQIATREAYGRSLAALGAQRGDIVALDGEVSNCTYAELFAQAHPDRYFEMFIAEQQLVAAAVGMQVRGYTAFASTFAAFFARGYDFVRMAAISRADLRLVGSHAGVSIGEDGPSQMALEDLAAFRAVHGSTVLHPSDANQTVRLVAAMADRPGISYLRTLRGKTPVRTSSDEDIRIGGSRLVRTYERDDQITVVAAGITVDQAERAADTLDAEGVQVRVLDCYSIKPIDAEALIKAAEETRGLVTVEDHWPEGGLGDAVLAALAERSVTAPVIKLAVTEMPTSGKPDELLHAAGIDAAAIVRAVRELASR